MKPRLLIFFLLATIIGHSQGLKSDKFIYGTEFRFGPSLVMYDSRTNSYFKNSVYTSGEMSVFIRNFVITGSIRYCYSHIKNLIIFSGLVLVPNDEIDISFRSLSFGYTYFVSKKFYIEPYFGFLRSDLTDKEVNHLINTQSGFLMGFSIVRYFTFPKMQLLLFVNNNFNISKFERANMVLGNNFYSVEIGVGTRFGKRRQ